MQVVNAVMDAEADQLCGGGANSRNGYRECGLIDAYKVMLRNWHCSIYDEGQSIGTLLCVFQFR